MTDLARHQNDVKPEQVASRRGPLRPVRLVSARRRLDRRLSTLRFRMIDVSYVVVATLWFLREMGGRPILDTTLAGVLPAVSVVWSAGSVFGATGGYEFGRHARLVGRFARIVFGGVVGTTLGVLAALVTRPTGYAAADIVWLGVLWTVGIGILHLVWWFLVRRWGRRGLLTPNVVVVGATDHAEEFVATTLLGRQMNILGVFDDRLERAPSDVHGVPVLGTTDDLVRHRVMPFVDLVIVAVDPAATSRVGHLTDRLATLPTPVTLLIDHVDPGRRSEAIEELCSAPLASLRTGTDPARRAFVKRVADLVIATAAFVALLPLMVLIAVAIRIDSGGPVFFRQVRHGFGNEEIRVWKFRTMHDGRSDAHVVRQVTSNDERVTRVGRILRSTSLDELPQLVNVIVGEMSLVGPRPHAPLMKTGDTFSCDLVRHYAHRHRIRPGMTGWAAIHGSRGPLHDADDVRRRVAFDIDYIERQTFWLDLTIMLRTVPSMLGDREAIR